MTRAAPLLSAAIALSAPIASAQAPSARLFYTRADAIVSATGEASLRRAYARQLDLPSEHCDGERFTCLDHRVYGQVYAIEFVEEIASRKTDGPPSIDRRERGRVTIAADFSKEDADRFEDDLVAYLGRLGAPSFAKTHAGLRFLDPPLEQDTLVKSAAPVWLCGELRGSYAYNLVIRDESGTVRTYSDTRDRAAEPCRTIERAIGDPAPDRFRTMPDVRVQLRREVRLATASTLRGLTWANDLAPIPEGASLKKTPLAAGARTGATRERRNGVFVGHEGRYGGVEHDVQLPRASLDLAGAPMWVARWTFESVQEQFGPEPQRSSGGRALLLVAAVPIADPTMDDIDRAKLDLTVPEEPIAKSVMGRLTRSANPGPADVAAALSDPGVWPSQGEWMVVTCYGDGSARYGIPPFADAAEVTNAREQCAVIRRVAGD